MQCLKQSLRSQDIQKPSPPPILLDSLLRPLAQLVEGDERDEEGRALHAEDGPQRRQERRRRRRRLGRRLFGQQLLLLILLVLGGSGGGEMEETWVKPT